MYGIPVIFKCFLRVGGCPEGPGGSLWAVLAAHWLPACYCCIPLADWVATEVGRGTPKSRDPSQGRGKGHFWVGSRNQVRRLSNHPLLACKLPNYRLTRLTGLTGFEAYRTDKAYMLAGVICLSFSAWWP